MSPVSRGRKGRKSRKSTSRPGPVDLFGAQDGCDCPACSGADLDPERLIDALTAGAADLLVSEDPLDVEIAGATFVAIGEVAGEVFEEALVGGLIPAFEARATPEALAMLLALGSVAEGQAAKVASAAAGRLVDAGTPAPGWAAELNEPVTVADCWRLLDPHGTGSILACSFHRAGRSHAVIMTVDHLHCGAAGEILLLDADHLPEALDIARADLGGVGLEITTEAPDPAEFRWHLENALDARAVHDDARPDLGPDEAPADDDGPDYRTMAVLLRTRMNALPASNRPRAPHADADGPLFGLTPQQILAQFAGDGAGPFGALLPVRPRGRVTAAKLPAKRRKSGGPAPVYQLKVGLRGAKPPIWRRLEVPADISLDRLHAVIQVAFDWDDSHLHVFETPYGSFGAPDAELGHRAESSVTLEQVAPDPRSKISYTYDFGDDWEHDILVEKAFVRDSAARYPRCTGGRRAAPPEDCGGIWGYESLTEVLADPDHPEHDDRLEWLGLDHAAEFEPAAFDAGEVTDALARLR
jgi:hypothetical protein